MIAGEAVSSTLAGWSGPAVRGSAAPLPRRGLLGAALALAAYAGLAVWSSGSQSATFDEPIHLPPGYANLHLGDHRMNPDHPPLVRILAAAPLLLMDVRFDEADHAWATSRPWEFGKRFLYRWNDADRLLFWGRLPIVGLGAALGLSVFLWTRRHWGTPAALAALALFALSPDMLAHGRIVTNDLGITLFIFLTIVAFERLTAAVSWTRLAGAGAALGAALATKFSAVGLLPILALLALVVALARGPLVVRLPPLRSGTVDTRAGRLGVLAAALLAMAAVGVLVVWAAYGFSSPLSPDPRVSAAFDWQALEAASPLVRVPLELARAAWLLPESWVFGFLHFVVHAESRPAFLLGEYSEAGWWYYFPVTFLLKTPLPLLVLVVTALARLARQGSGWRLEAFVWLPALFFFTITLTRNINIGHRHLLPIYPFLFVAAGRAAGSLWTARARGPTPAWRTRLGPAALAMLAAWYAGGTLRVHPHYLAYFNEVGGGPRNGYRHLVDSNLDWGQGLKALKRWMDGAGVARVKLCYFGTADPLYHGIGGERLPGYQPPPPSTVVREVRPGDIVAVSATHLQGVYLDPAMRPLMERLRERRPVAVPGYAIFVYRADFTWRLP